MTLDEKLLVVALNIDKGNAFYRNGVERMQTTTRDAQPLFGVPANLNLLTDPAFALHQRTCASDGAIANAKECAVMTKTT